MKLLLGYSFQVPVVAELICCILCVSVSLQIRTSCNKWLSRHVCWHLNKNHRLILSARIWYIILIEGP
ncbi:hypothetical protein ECOT7509_1723 [Escherichia coli TW07509]|nr:hypothetical protein ECOT7509_1723 [Escherichia coli TW07509]